jgi:hypothetical protein
MTTLLTRLCRADPHQCISSLHSMHYLIMIVILLLSPPLNFGFKLLQIIQEYFSGLFVQRVLILAFLFDFEIIKFCLYDFQFFLLIL